MHGAATTAIETDRPVGTLRSASVCSTDLPFVKPQRWANLWMCVSTGNVGVLQLASAFATTNSPYHQNAGLRLATYPQAGFPHPARKACVERH